MGLEGEACQSGIWWCVLSFELCGSLLTERIFEFQKKSLISQKSMLECERRTGESME